MATPPAAPRSRRVNNPDAMRQRILDAAAMTFQQQGSSSTGMRDLCKVAGVTVGALYHHFPTKRDLTVAVIEERVRPEIADTWISVVENAATAREGIGRVFEDVAAALERSGKVSGCPLGNLASELSLADPELRASLVVEYEIWRRAIVTSLRADDAKGLAVIPDPENLAYVVIAMFTGAMTMGKAEQAATALRACLTALNALLDVPGRGKSP